MSNRYATSRDRFLKLLIAILVGLIVNSVAHAQSDPLPSWNETAAKKAIVDFVKRTTTVGSIDYLPTDDRIATFDNDGTLWSEQPLYFQAVFMIEQVKTQRANHPEWNDNPVFKAIMANDRDALVALGQKPILELLAIANSGMTTEEYDQSIRNWLATARHPRFNRPYTDLVYKPMQELLTYLRANGFKTYIVSGGSIEFMRPWVGRAYGIPSEQVVGTVSQVKYEMMSGAPVLRREPKIDFVDDGPGKPVGIYRVIGRRPAAAFGNSDGDLEMLQWTAAGTRHPLVMIVRHTDAEREYSYDRESRIGKLDKALDEANQRGWTVVDMKRDWKAIYAFQK